MFLMAIPYILTITKKFVNTAKASIMRNVVLEMREIAIRELEK